MPPDDEVRLRHLVDAAETAIRFASDRSRADLDTDEMLALALTKLVEIVGEAAKQVSGETKDAHPEIPGRRQPGCGIDWCTTTSTSISMSSGPPFGRTYRPCSRWFLRMVPGDEPIRAMTA